MRLDGRTAVVTGAAPGIGLTTALATEGILVDAVAPAVIGTELPQQMTKEMYDLSGGRATY